MFRVGQKVVCVDASTWESFQFIKRDAVYTISGITRKFDREYLHLVEITSPRNCGYYASRFRPVVERKTDISIFEAMLNPAKKKRRADRPVTVS